MLATELEPAAVLDEVVQQASALLAADACAVRTLEDDELVVSAAVGDGSADALGSRASASAWLSGDVFQSRAPLAVEDVTADARLAAADPVVAAGYRAFLGVPLVGPEGAPSGVLAVYARRPRAWRSEEIEALQALAGNTASDWAAIFNKHGVPAGEVLDVPAVLDHPQIVERELLRNFEEPPGVGRDSGRACRLPACER